MRNLSRPPTVGQDTALSLPGSRSSSKPHAVPESMHTKTMDYRVEDEQLVGLNKSLYQKRRSGNVANARFLNNDFAPVG